MNKAFPVIVSILIIASFESCSKKHTPSRTETNTEEVKIKPTPVESTVAIEKKNDSMVAVKPVVKKTPTTAPKVIAVNDKFAKKSVDGRYYYDLEGHRYWRSNKDGKYYIYNKSMQNDPDFQKPR